MIQFQNELVKFSEFVSQILNAPVVAIKEEESDEDEKIKFETPCGSLKTRQTSFSTHAPVTLIIPSMSTLRRRSQRRIGYRHTRGICTQTFSDSFDVALRQICKYNMNTFRFLVNLSGSIQKNILFEQ